MSFLRKALRSLTRLGIFPGDSRRKIIPQINFCSSITPVKMAVEIISSNNTNRNIPSLIVMHGFLGSRKNLHHLCIGLEATTKRMIYNVDARNHGNSPHVAAHSSAHMAADIAFLIKEYDLQRVSLLGHSMGGRTMMYFALKYPELVEKAIIVDISPVSFPANKERWNMDTVFKSMKSVNVPPNLPFVKGKAVAEQQMMTILKDKDAVNFLISNLTKDKSGKFVWMSNVEALHASFSRFVLTQCFTDMPPFPKPVLFIAGNRSKFLNPDDWPKIKEIFPYAELKWLEGGHLIHFTQAQQFIKLATDFLRT